MDEGEEGVDESACVFGSGELGEAKALGNTCYESCLEEGSCGGSTGRMLRGKGKGRKESSMHCGTIAREMGQVPVALSRIIVTDSMLQPLLVR